MLVQHKTSLENWHSLKDAVKEGGIDLFTRTHGMNVFDYMSVGRDPRFTDLFNKVMGTLSAMVMPKIPQHYRGFSKVKTVVDVGGGIGEILKIILSNNPHIRAINYGLPHVIAAATPIPSKIGHNDFEGIEHVGGDIVKSVPKADVHLLKWVLHCGNDEFCVKVLKNCWEALPPTVKVVIMEVVIPENPRTDKLSKSSFFLDVTMLKITPGGKDRTRREYADLAHASRFHTPKYVLHAYNMWLIALHKKIW